MTFKELAEYILRQPKEVQNSEAYAYYGGDEGEGDQYRPVIGLRKGKGCDYDGNNQTEIYTFQFEPTKEGRWESESEHTLYVDEAILD